MGTLKLRRKKICNIPQLGSNTLSLLGRHYLLSIMYEEITKAEQEASQLLEKLMSLLHRSLHSTSLNTEQQSPVHLLNEIHKNSHAKKRVELLKDEADKTKPKLF